MSDRSISSTILRTCVLCRCGNLSYRDG